MNDSKRPEGGWDELADLLGLPAEDPAPSAPPMPVKTERAPLPEPRVEVEHRPTFQAETPPPAPPIEEATSLGWEEEFEEEIDSPHDDAQIAAPPMEEPDADPLELGPPRPGDEEKPKRGRRRRRRGRRRGGDRPEGEEQDHAAPRIGEIPDRPVRDAHAEQRDRRDGRQGRGRPRDDDRRRTGPAQPPREPVEDIETDDLHDEPKATPRRAITADDTDFSDWNVPSWGDLIAALYRPDR